MNCLEFRRLLGSDPQSDVVDFVRHRQECARCAEAAARALEFDSSLRRALAIEAPTALAESILLAQATRQQGRRRLLRRGGVLALAASLILAVGIGMRVEANPLSTLAVDHLGGEAFALSLTKPVSAAEVEQAFAKRGVDLPSAPDGISYVSLLPGGTFFVRAHGDAGNRRSGHGDVRRQSSLRATPGFRPRRLVRPQRAVGNGTLVLLARNTDHFDPGGKCLAHCVAGSSQSFLIELTDRSRIRRADSHADSANPRSHSVLDFCCRRPSSRMSAKVVAVIANISATSSNPARR